MDPIMNLDGCVENSEQSLLSTADWRWAAEKGYWNPQTKCWNEEMGGAEAYIRQRNERKDARLARRSRKQSLPRTGFDLGSRPSFQIKKKAEDFHPTFLDHNHFVKRQYQSSDCYAIETVSRSCPQTIPSALSIETNEHYNGIDIDNPLLSFMRLQGWACPSVLRHWTVGYKAEPIISLFRALPHRLKLYMAHAVKFSGSDPSSSDCAERMEGTKMWEGEAVQGFICARFDPTSQACLHVTANERFAAMMGMHREELLARFARHDAPLPAPPLDCLRALLHGLAAPRAPYRTRYYRLVPPPPGDGRPAAPPALVCATAVRVYDRSNRIVAVRRERTGREVG